MKYIESEYMELKEKVNSDFKKEIVAFANTNGGEIYVGISRNGEIVGVDNAEAEMERISNMIRDGIKPDITAYTTLERFTEDEKNIIKVNVLRGEKRPYHISDKGLRPAGVYIRHGVTSAPASDEAIRQMLKESDGTAFDKARSANQDLTFDYAESFFARRGLSLNNSNKRTLKLITSDGYYTNAALLLSDQCEHSIKCALYNGSGKMEFQARKEFFGSILKQMDEAYAYIALCNKNRSTFEGLRRIDIQDYPEFAIREALLNTIVHRDYDYSGCTIINIFTDRMEFVSLGGLVKGLTLTDILGGVSQSRNSVIASVFYRLELIESYGTGIKRIMESYEGNSVQPSFAPAPASFVVTLPNVNENPSLRFDTNLTDEEKVLKLFETSKYITRKDVERLLQSSSFPAINILNKLLEEKRILRVGSARSTKYIATESLESNRYHVAETTPHYGKKR